MTMIGFQHQSVYRIKSLLFSLLAINCLHYSAAQVPLNDACDDAISLDTTQGQLIKGSTVNGTSDGLNLCGENLVNSPGVWYTYQTTTTEKIVQISTCTAETDFDTAVSVFSGFCPNLKCEGGRDDDLECDAGEEQHSTISWRASVNQRYYILVHGSKAEHSGNFGLITTETDPLEEPDSAAIQYSTAWSLVMIVSLGAALLTK